MQVPLQVTFRDIPHSAAVMAHVRNKAERLQHFSDKIVACQVVVELVSRHQLQGNSYNTRLILTIPNKELVSTHNHNENMYISIRDAFDDMVRQLEEAANKMRGQVKAHPATLEGVIDRLFAEGFGFICTANGDEYYFDVSSIRHYQNRLQEGLHVHFTPFLADAGWQAHRIGIHRRDEAKAVNG